MSTSPNSPAMCSCNLLREAYLVTHVSSNTGKREYLGRGIGPPSRVESAAASEVKSLKKTLGGSQRAEKKAEKSLFMPVAKFLEHSVRYAIVTTGRAWQQLPGNQVCQTFPMMRTSLAQQRC